MRYKLLAMCYYFYFLKYILIWIFLTAFFFTDYIWEVWTLWWLTIDTNQYNWFLFYQIGTEAKKVL